MIRLLHPPTDKQAPQQSSPARPPLAGPPVSPGLIMLGVVACVAITVGVVYLMRRRAAAAGSVALIPPGTPPAVVVPPTVAPVVVPAAPIVPATP